MRESAQIYDVRMAQFVLKIEKLSHIMVPRGSQYLRSPSPIMAPAKARYEKPLKNHSLEVAMQKHLEMYSSSNAAAQNPEERVKIIKTAHNKKVNRQGD